MITMLDRETTRTHLGKRIRELRIAQGLSQQQFAEKVGIHYTNLCRIEKGQIAPEMHVCFNIADALGVGVDTLRGISSPVSR